MAPPFAALAGTLAASRRHSRSENVGCRGDEAARLESIQPGRDDSPLGASASGRPAACCPPAPGGPPPTPPSGRSSSRCRPGPRTPGRWNRTRGGAAAHRRRGAGSPGGRADRTAPSPPGRPTRIPRRRSRRRPGEAADRRAVDRTAGSAASSLSAPCSPCSRGRRAAPDRRDAVCRHRAIRWSRQSSAPRSSARRGARQEIHLGLADQTEIAAVQVGAAMPRMNSPTTESRRSSRTRVPLALSTPRPAWEAGPFGDELRTSGGVRQGGEQLAHGSPRGGVTVDRPGTVAAGEPRRVGRPDDADDVHGPARRRRAESIRGVRWPSRDHGGQRGGAPQQHECHRAPWRAGPAAGAHPALPAQAPAAGTAPGYAAAAA